MALSNRKGRTLNKEQPKKPPAVQWGREGLPGQAAGRRKERWKETEPCRMQKRKGGVGAKAAVEVRRGRERVMAAA